MPVYDDLPRLCMYPGPELTIRAIHEPLAITSILDVGAGHGGVFDYAYWTSRPMEKRAACDIHWIRPMDPSWDCKIGVNVAELDKHYPQKSFDFVQCMETMEHVPEADHEMALTQLIKVAKKLVVLTSCDEMHHLGPEQEAIEKINQYQKYQVQPSVQLLKSLGFQVYAEETVRRQLIAYKVI